MRSLDHINTVGRLPALPGAKITALVLGVSLSGSKAGNCFDEK